MTVVALGKPYTALELRVRKRSGAENCIDRLPMPGRVLVVDDDESIRILIQRLLSKHGFAVETASDGGVALDMLSKEDYDALVLDLMMPRVDGFTVLRQLIATRPDLLAKTVVATAYPKDVAKRQLNEVCRVIIKPFDTLELVDAVRRCAEDTEIR